MFIKFVEIANFRKLLAIRVDLSARTTLFVGANNSGKTSAMLALRKFLSSRGRSFETHDVTLCNWPAINAIGQKWLSAQSAQITVALDMQEWADVVPTLDLWLHVDADELHYVRDLNFDLEFEGGLLGVRLRLEPKNLEDLFKDDLSAAADAAAIKAAAAVASASASGVAAAPAKLTVWPSDLIDFLNRKLSSYFVVRAYPLDLTKVATPVSSQAVLQVLGPEVEPLEGDPLSGLIRVNEISAQRGFGEAQPHDDEESLPRRAGGSRLSDQLRDYYKKHLDPTDRPDPSDLGALQAIEAAQDAFDARLTESFSAAFSEVEGMVLAAVSIRV
jgi:predicted ATP-dependent endonuclease of OLD family